ncbi:PilN domain-containing protein [Teredinibacter waterburyi]|jgi:Tfp pilus assembly protein PilN|uniref:PilN domain-containing protein n=1 Tax=Teredinibacter waterburyi TaxID=1500538 RepID=UPI00165FEC5D|nr:PilN domain-containing protein [Teredinibacter waterburyi]
MAQINLLPWREEYRLERKKEFLSQLAGVCLLAVGVSFLWIKSVDAQISTQNERNRMLNAEISQLNEQVKEIKTLKKERSELLSRMKVIQALEGTRSIIVHYFDEFTKAIPDGVFITSLSRRGNSFQIEGISESNNRVSTFMRQLDESEWFSDPNLRSVTASPAYGNQASEFKMQLKAVIPDESNDGDK